MQPMLGLMLIAHAPLASALKQVAEHAFPSCAPQLAVLDVPPEMEVAEIQARARALIAAAGYREVLVLCDVFGATPCNAALGLRELPDVRVRVLSGVNVPMLWRSLCYSGESLDQVLQRASQGGAQGIVPDEPSSNPVS
ncbi:PTS fructose transporter subunit IIA [Pelomonas sp. CA6]|uniref:PTS sugar transporter subunit IIA n=1 Tax=Pelomonas sp. CA6 TaxID=2907999 RepID=UPI001F4BEC23|nr:PTS fructose transporter subunit IIA [Pelomonas sp. CA6]MCH7345973.1 PTS fructose transporter subunit IIA [Pelomonas sp. CA6]